MRGKDIQDILVGTEIGPIKEICLLGVQNEATHHVLAGACQESIV